MFCQGKTNMRVEVNNFVTSIGLVILQWLTVLLPVASLLLLLRQPKHPSQVAQSAVDEHAFPAAQNSNALPIIWAIFCASLAAMTLQRWHAGSTDISALLLGFAASATCNVFWLVARGLFRAGNWLQMPQVLFAAAIALLLMGDQTLHWLHLRSQLAEPIYSRALPALRELIQLLSSTALVMAFWEGLRGARSTSGSERVMRWIFLLSYGTCLTLGLIVPSMASSPEQSQLWKQNAVIVCVLLIVVTTHGLIRFRLQHPLAESDAAGAGVEVDTSHASALTVELIPTNERIASDEEHIIAQRMLQQLLEQRWYLQADLKVAGLAALLGVAEYKVSRAITLVLGIANFNQFINRYRIEYAQRLLADTANAHWPILVIGLESGFASLGPFNRAFKSIVGSTPSDFRSACMAQRVAIEVEPCSAT
jgi:AraC-like DNA-binding protein